ncbi:MAG: flagellar biosynthetic protein FliO [Betaproteobacteria bacterium]
MNQALVSVVVFVVLLAMLPLALKRITQHRLRGTDAAVASSRLVSVLALGTQQRVVTVEVGPQGERTWLVLGVTPQSMTLLHTMVPGSAMATETHLGAPQPTATVDVHV